MDCVVSCGQFEDLVMSNLYESITSHHAGLRVPSEQLSTKSGLSTMGSNSASRRMSRAACCELLPISLLMVSDNKIAKVLYSLTILQGRSLMITPRTIAKEGFVDIDREDYKDTPEDEYLKKVQASQLVIIKDKWLDDYKVRIYKD